MTWPTDEQVEKAAITLYGVDIGFPASMEKIAAMFDALPDDEPAWYLAKARAALTAVNPFGGERVRHKKRGSTYTVIGAALVQANEPIADDAELVLYRSDSGMIFARPPSEFNDGRFEYLPSPPQEGK